MNADKCSSPHSPDGRFAAAVPLPPDLLEPFRALWQAVPAGRVTTYGDLAKGLGDVAASIWVSAILKSHSGGTECVCHRVVRADGALGNYAHGDVEAKRRRLVAEGIPLVGQKVLLERIRDRPTLASPPLATLAALQATWAAHVDRSRLATWNVIGGVDVSYGGDLAYASYVELLRGAREPHYSRTIAAETAFPYIRGYLAFREWWTIEKLLTVVEQEHALPDLLMVDGSGIAHPRRCGIASLIGLRRDLPTIGVTKHHLDGNPVSAGEAAGSWWLVDQANDDRIGAIVIPQGGRGRADYPALYVSPGHRVTVEQAAQITTDFCQGRRLPDPIYWADRISRAAARARRNTDPHAAATPSRSSADQP